MDWSKQSEEQIQLLIKGIIFSFQGVYDFERFLMLHSIGRNDLHSIVDTYEDQVADYVRHAQGRWMVPKVVDAMMDSPKFVQFVKDHGTFVGPDIWQRHTTREFYRNSEKESTTQQAPVVPKVEVKGPDPNWDDLSGKQLKFLREAIDKAFTPKEFDIFLVETLSRRPLAIHSAAGPFPQQLFDFLQTVQAEGWVKELVTGLETTNKPAVRNLASDMGKVTR